MPETKAIPSHLVSSDTIYFMYNHLGDMDSLYEFYKVDLSPNYDDVQKIRSLPDPLFKLDKTYPELMGFFMIKTRVYLIGGSLSSIEKTTMVLDTHFFDLETLCKEEPFSPKLFSKGPPMNGGKLQPVVVVIEDRAYVIAQSFNPRWWECPAPRFEVFDPKSMSWTILPEPSFSVDLGPTYPSDKGRIRAYTAHNTTIYISLQIGIYSFDVKLPENGWKPLSNSLSICQFPFRAGAVRLNGMSYAVSRWVSHLNAFDFDGEDEHFKEFEVHDLNVSYSPLTHYSPQNFIATMGNDKLCFVQVGMDGNPDRFAVDGRKFKPHLIFTVFRPRREYLTDTKKTMLTNSEYIWCDNKYSVTFVMEKNAGDWGIIDACFSTSLEH